MDDCTVLRGLRERSGLRPPGDEVRDELVAIEGSARHVNRAGDAVTGRRAEGDQPSGRPISQW